MREVFDLLARVQRKRGLNLILIGGWALQAHHYSRNTLDVDCLTALEHEGPLSEELERAGFVCFEEKPAFRRFRHRLDELMVLDVMRVNADTFAKMWEASEPFRVDGVDLRVPALTHLIALKLHAAQNEHRTEKDLGDIHALLAVNPGKVSREVLAQLCDKFGTAALAARLPDIS
jgi:predicted nucleotidyltransferase